MAATTLLRTELPIIQAPMAGSQGSALAIAVSNAGGLGSLPCALLSLEAMRAELTTLRDGTSRPYNVNFFCHATPAADAERDRRWRRQLAPYYAEFGLTPPAGASAAARRAFDRETAAIVSEFRPPIVSFHFGLPAADLVAAVHGWGATILSSATTVEEARWLESHGADGVIAQGYEAGGHRGMFLSNDLATQVATSALVPQIVRAVRIPVIAAGGIADARGVAAVLALGAVAAQVGTAYLLCPEASTSAVHRAALKSPRASQTDVTNVFTGRPARGIVNRLMREVGPMADDVPAFPLAGGSVVPLRAAAEAIGRDDFSPLWAGQSAAACRDIPAARLTAELASLAR